MKNKKPTRVDISCLINDLTLKINFKLQGKSKLLDHLSINFNLHL